MAEKELFIRIQRSGFVHADWDTCVWCGTCVLMCSLYHEGEVSPELARIQVVRDPLNAEYRIYVCRQCLAPSCYAACSFIDEAIRIDEETGARYIDRDSCKLCKKCIPACPFEEPRIKLLAGKQTVVKCDLCRGREEGPICVEYCPVGALTLVTKEQRR